jgi:hypothetical protein
MEEGAHDSLTKEHRGVRPWTKELASKLAVHVITRTDHTARHEEFGKGKGIRVCNSAAHFFPAG